MKELSARYNGEPFLGGFFYVWKFCFNLNMEQANFNTTIENFILRTYKREWEKPN